MHVHGLVLDGVYRRTEGEPDFQEARAPSRDELAGLLEKIIARRFRLPLYCGRWAVLDGLRHPAKS